MNGDGSSSSPYEIRTASDLQAMQEDRSANYTVVNDIDASGTVNWNNGQGFNPVGTYDVEQANSEFTGGFDGQNHTISNLSINRLDEYVGLFGAISAGGEVKNVGVINVNMTGANDVGGLVGANYDGTVSNSYSTGNVTGEGWYVGGLVGENRKGNISNSYSTGNVTGGFKFVGGLAGYNRDGTVSNSYSTGNVSGEEEVGGLVGSDSGNISNSYSTGNVTGAYHVGGLVGRNVGTVSNSYSTGNVTGANDTGGLVGINGAIFNPGTVSNSYSTGNVTGEKEVGGVVGKNNDGTVSNSYWNSDSTITEGSTDVSTDNTKSGVPRTTSQMQGSSASSNMNFEFTSTWSTVTGDYPELQWQE
jgi:hypothetical protein